jgi:hypothetical protein
LLFHSNNNLRTLLKGFSRTDPHQRKWLGVGTSRRNDRFEVGIVRGIIMRGIIVRGIIVRVIIVRGIIVRGIMRGIMRVIRFGSLDLGLLWPIERIGNNRAVKQCFVVDHGDLPRGQHAWINPGQGDSLLGKWCRVQLVGEVR